MRTAVITGACGGIGLATANLFAERGWRVLAVDRRSRSDDLATDWFLRVDVGETGATTAIATALGDAPLHALVNNAGLSGDRSIPQVDRQLFDDVAATNLWAPMELVTGLLENLARVGGAIVNVASVHAVATSTNVSVYAATKGGLTAFTRAAAVELGPLGIRCNAVLPGAVDTAMLREGLDRRPDSGGAAGNRTALERRTPLGRVGQPSEIAEAILFLADDERSSFVTGHALTVDGGVTARLASE